MTVSLNLIWLTLAIGAIIVIVALLLRYGRPLSNSDAVRRIAESAARDVIESPDAQTVQRIAEKAAQEAVVSYEREQQRKRDEDTATRKERAARAKDTRTKRIEALREHWREPFILFVRNLAKPFFSEWRLNNQLLDRWSEQQADVYIQQRPYVLAIIRDIHADAQKAAERYANLAEKSPREIARERARTKARGLVRNPNCPYCGTLLPPKARLDHIVPVQRGGPSEPWNLVYACKRCNWAKGALPLEEFANTSYAKDLGLTLELMIINLTELQKVVEVSDLTGRDEITLADSIESIGQQFHKSTVAHYEPEPENNEGLTETFPTQEK